MKSLIKTQIMNQCCTKCTRWPKCFWMSLNFIWDFIYNRILWQYLVTDNWLVSIIWLMTLLIKLWKLIWEGRVLLSNCCKVLIAIILRLLRYLKMLSSVSSHFWRRNCLVFWTSHWDFKRIILECLNVVMLPVGRSMIVWKKITDLCHCWVNIISLYVRFTWVATPFRCKGT
jgi:hypothetical protein